MMSLIGEDDSAIPTSAPIQLTLASLCQAIESLQQMLERRLDSLQGLLAGNLKELLTVEEVAAMTRRSEYTVRRWISEGKLNATRIAEGGPRGRLLIPRAELERLIAAGKGGNIPPSAI